METQDLHTRGVGTKQLADYAGEVLEYDWDARSAQAVLEAKIHWLLRQQICASFQSSSLIHGDPTSWHGIHVHQPQRENECIDHVSLATLDAVSEKGIRYTAASKSSGTGGACYSYELDARSEQEQKKASVKCEAK